MPDAIHLRNSALDFRRALSSSESWQIEAWIELTKRCKFGPPVRFASGLQRTWRRSLPPSKLHGATVRSKDRSIG
jgi:hypothetical protein